ncbi:MAG: response regulator [Bradymonadaceae bacterium]
MSNEREVLLLDDDLMAVMEAEEYLQTGGWSVESLSTPSGALSKIDYEQPDALMVDIEMDQLDVEELVQTLRSSPDHRDLVIVAFADRPPEELREYCVDHDVNGYFSKSMDVSQIAGFLDQFFEDEG